MTTNYERAFEPHPEVYVAWDQLDGRSRLGLDIPAVVADPAAAGLDEADIAVMDLAAKVATDAASVTAGDRRRLIDLGVPAHEVEWVVLAAAARCFFSKSLDGLGAAPDVGRPIAEA